MTCSSLSIPSFPPCSEPETNAVGDDVGVAVEAALGDAERRIVRCSMAVSGCFPPAMSEAFTNPRRSTSCREKRKARCWGSRAKWPTTIPTSIRHPIPPNRPKSTYGDPSVVPLEGAPQNLHGVSFHTFAISRVSAADLASNIAIRKIRPILP